MIQPWIIQSQGLGVESAAITARWLLEEESRDFTLDRLIIITSQVGEEHEDTVRDFEKYILPLLRFYNVRFVEVARKGHLEKEGIAILQDTRQPRQLHPEGCYKLSDELLMAGTVPQVGGEHRCALKFKGFVVETWLRDYFGKEPLQHVFGYNVEEPKRIDKCDGAITARFPASMVFGFNADETKRIDKAQKYDGPYRVGRYPLKEWGWTRQDCIDYLKKIFGIIWMKSACPFCPFNKEAANGTEIGLERLRNHPTKTAHGAFVEYLSLCMNPRGVLYGKACLLDLLRKHNVTDALEALERRLDESQWAVYRVRRIYKKKGKADRCVELLVNGTRADVAQAFKNFRTESPHLELETIRGIDYLYFARRRDAYPAVEGYYVMAPKTMKTKVRGKLEVFDSRWITATTIAGTTVAA